MTLKQLSDEMDKCEAAGFDVDAMEAGDLYNNDVPPWVRQVLSVDLVRRWSEKRTAELAAK